MSTRRAIAWGLLICGLVVASLGTWSAQQRTRAPAPGVRKSPQCGQLAVLRCCELLGAPVSLDAIMKQLPYAQEGHSLQQVSETLTWAGLNSEGRQEDGAALAAGPFPCVAHLTRPEHFVVVSGSDTVHVHLFDCWGRRTSIPWKRFNEGWSGYALHVSRTPRPTDAPSDGVPARPAPIAAFDAFFIDKGTVPYTGQPVKFTYRFRNVGNADLWVLGVHTSCKCVDSVAPEGPIAPGGEGRIELSYRSNYDGGVFTHFAAVETNDPNLKSFKLQAAGLVATGVKAQPAFLDFGEVAAGESCTRICYVRYTGPESDFSIQAVESDEPGITTAVSDRFATEPAVGRPTRGGVSESDRPIRKLEVTLTPQAGAAGELKGRLAMRTDRAGYERVEIPWTARRVEPVALYPKLVTYDMTASRPAAERRIQVAGVRQRRVRIAAITGAPDWLECLFDPAAEGNLGHLTLKGLPMNLKTPLDLNVDVDVALMETAAHIHLPLRLRVIPPEGATVNGRN